MSSLTPGSVVLLHTGQPRPLRVRVLAPVELSGDWSVPVMVAAQEVGAVSGALEVPGPQGVGRVAAQLVRDVSGAVLRAAPVRVGSAAVPLVQRREQVRAPVRLVVRGMLLPEGLDRVSDLADGEAELSGHSSDLSGSGLALRWDCGAPTDPPGLGRRLYLELDMPQGHQRRGALVQVVAEVVASGPAGVQVRFVDLAPIDRERLIALVFQVQRSELARRGSR